MDTYYSIYCDSCKYSGGVWSPGNITNSCMQVKGEQRSAGKDNILGQVGNLIKLYKNCYLLLLYCCVPLASSVIQNEKRPQEEEGAQRATQISKQMYAGIKVNKDYRKTDDDNLSPASLNIHRHFTGESEMLPSLTEMAYLIV